MVIVWILFECRTTVLVPVPIKIVLQAKALPILRGAGVSHWYARRRHSPQWHSLLDGPLLDAQFVPTCTVYPHTKGLLVRVSERNLFFPSLLHVSALETGLLLCKSSLLWDMAAQTSVGINRQPKWPRAARNNLKLQWAKCHVRILVFLLTLLLQCTKFFASIAIFNNLQ
jgi:hypothetical protein